MVIFAHGYLERSVSKAFDLSGDPWMQDGLTIKLHAERLNQILNFDWRFRSVALD